MQKKIFLSIIFFIFSFYQVSKSEIIYGEATVVDGDTIKINDNKIRLFGIDAPEKKQMCKKIFLSISFFSFEKDYPCGVISTQKLKNLLNKKIIKCYVEGKDIFKRKLAICFRNKLNINSWLVRNGHAVAYKKYSKKYLMEEIEAKNDKRGLWQGKFEMPWDWRKNVKK
tara:strand:- start:899 stop:1405 length:507 start_codon:yes stop_codon:yes gene_type:complete